MRSVYIFLISILVIVAMPVKGIQQLKSSIVTEGGNNDQVVLTAPEIKNIEKWINSKPLSMHSLRGKVVLISFWNYHCSSCTRNIPTLKKWHSKYKDKGLEVVSIHVPFLGVGRSPEVVASNVDWYEIKYPVALDNKFTTYSSYGIRSIPSVFLVGPDGKIIYGEEGSMSYGRTENYIRKALKELKHQ